MTPQRFPKIDSPYYREESDEGHYVVTPKDGRVVKPGYEWVFDRASEVGAVEKFDGTNLAVVLDDGELVEAYTRMGGRSMQPVEPFGPTNHHYLTRGVQNAIRKGYFDDLDGLHFGELIGPKLQGNPHGLDAHLFIPFERARRVYQYRSYGDYPTDLDAIRGWLEGGDGGGIFSLLAARQHDLDYDECRPASGAYIEGLIFVHPDLNRIHPDCWTVEDGRVRELAKVRRDMFAGYYDDWPTPEEDDDV